MDCRTDFCVQLTRKKSTKQCFFSILQNLKVKSSCYSSVYNLGIILSVLPIEFFVIDLFFKTVVDAYLFNQFTC